MDEKYSELLELKDELEYARDSFNIKKYKDHIDVIIDEVKADIEEIEKTLLNEQRQEEREMNYQYERSVI